MLKVHAVLVNEVPEDTINAVGCPLEPVFLGRLDIEHGPAVKLGRVHLANLVLSTVLATVDSSDDQSLGVKVPPVELAAVGQLEETLTDLDSRAVNLVEEEHHRLLTGSDKPVRSVPSGSLATVDLGVSRVRQAKKVTLGHLAGAALDHWQVTSSGDLVDHLGLADTVTTAQKHGELVVEDVRSDGSECCEVDSHVEFSKREGCSLSLHYKYSTGRH